MAYDYYLTLMDGSAPLREPATALAVDPWLPVKEQSAIVTPVVPENTTPTPLTCENVSDSVVVTTVNSNVVCNSVDTSGLFLLAGFLDAVNVERRIGFRRAGLLP